MGKYINKVEDKVLPALGKAEFLIIKANAEVIDPPAKFTENLVCVVNNGPFEAAAYAYNEQEMKEFLYPDGRPRMWLIVPHADKLAQ